MGIKLFEHNIDAYRAAVSMMNETGKAAVIQPTGTGKSFIGFKLAEDNPAKKILWLTPSEYIVRTQLENLEREGGAVLDNITFVTYARLMRMTAADVQTISADYAVLDEFHRAGAERWSEGIASFCRSHPNTKLLGLSATHIRYLDGRRDMAEELFDGNIASVMTLGEAVVRGILTPPKYVLSVFSYQKELEKYEKRISRSRSRAVRDACGKYLNALRRALQRADGLDRVFEKHMTDKSGKYIVFCTSRAHMKEMAALVPKWFGRVDSRPNVYTAYSDNPEASREFAEFKADCSERLKLLFCIDMLNEGVHIDGISGVILLRPTVSPIIYKQQIGRALAAGGGGQSVIFDIVLNFENLHSVNEVREEMSDIIRFYGENGENGNIVNSDFEIIDEVRDCRRLFGELEHALSASWDCMYDAAREYYRENGNLLPRQSYVSEEGYGLGQWLTAQRSAYANGELSRSRIVRLETIGMSWLTNHERIWEQTFEKAAAYYRKYGSLESGNAEYSEISQWIIRQREKYRNGKLSAEYTDRLSEIGMIWDTDEAWRHSYGLARKYFEENGSLDIPAGYIAEDGTALGAWYRSVRRGYLDGTIGEEKSCLLEKIGIESASLNARTWLKMYGIAKEYFEKHGDLSINAKYTADSGEKIGVWISGQRYMYRQGKLTAEQIDALERIGMKWQRYRDRWETGIAYAEEYFEENGSLDAAADYVTDDGFALGRWLASQRRKYKAEKLSADCIERLSKLGFVWNAAGAAWETGFADLARYSAKCGSANPSAELVTETGFALGAWAANQKTAYRTGKLSRERIERLENIGFVWDAYKEKWQRGYDHAVEYVRRNPNVKIVSGLVSDDGYRLGEWLRSQRRSYKNGSLTAERANLLNSMGLL